VCTRQEQYRLVAELHRTEHALDVTRAWSVVGEILHDMHGFTFRLVRQSAATSNMLRLAVDLDTVVARTRTEDGTTRFADRAFGATGTCVTCTLLTVQLARTSGDFTALFGFVRTLTAVGLDTTDIQPDGVVVRLYTENRLIQGNRLLGSRSVLFVDLDFHCL